MFALRAPAAQAARRFSSTPLAAVKKPAADKAPEGQNLVANTALPNVGMAYGGSGGKGPLGGREGAMEDQWAYQHDKELLQKMLARMKQMEDALKEKGIELPEQKKQ